MAHRVVFSPEAEAQIVSLHRYVATASSLANADRFTDAIVTFCERFRTSPRRGTRRDDIRPGLRTIGFRRRVTVAFAVDDDTVTILGIFYGGRDYASAFRHEGEA